MSELEDWSESESENESLEISFLSVFSLLGASFVTSLRLLVFGAALFFAGYSSGLVFSGGRSSSSNCSKFSELFVMKLSSSTRFSSFDFDCSSSSICFRDLCTRFVIRDSPFGSLAGCFTETLIWFTWRGEFALL